MNILLLDTSGPVCGVGVTADGTPVYENWVINKKTHSQKIMPMVDTALNMLDMNVDDIDVFAAVVGPGSFTGVRIGVATAKGLAHATGKKCVAVHALEALAAGISEHGRLVCPILDARAKQVYGAIFRSAVIPERLSEDMAIGIDGYIERIREYHEPALFLGDGIGPLEEEIRARLKTDCEFASPEHAVLRPAVASMLAVRKIEAGEPICDPETLLPLYLRAPQAERERKRKEAERAESAGGRDS